MVLQSICREVNTTRAGSQECSGEELFVGTATSALVSSEIVGQALWTVIQTEIPEITEKERRGGLAFRTFLGQMFPSGWTWPHSQLDNSGSGRKSEQQRGLCKLLHHSLRSSGMLSSCALPWSDSHYLQWHLIDSKWHSLRASHGGWFRKGHWRTMSHFTSGPFTARSNSVQKYKFF